jgi:hypothetical protein
MTIAVNALFEALNINDIQHNDTQHNNNRRKALT